MKIIQANRITLDETQLFAASHLGLFCLHMFHKNDARLICVNFLLDMVLHIKDFKGIGLQAFTCT